MNKLYKIYKESELFCDEYNEYERKTNKQTNKHPH